MSVFIVAEVGPNHNGSPKLARTYVELLADTGVDAIKFQLGNPEKTYSLDAFKAQYQLHNDNAVEVIEAAKRRQLTRSVHIELAELCQQKGVEYLCTAFDLESLIFLDEEINVQRFKIASGEIFSFDMMDYLAKKEQPIMMSTGMATYNEIEVALSRLDPLHKNDVTLLHCVSSYPAAAIKVNLRVMMELSRRFNRKIGYSDHVLGPEAAIAAVALGATIIEKHVTLDKNLPGPDHKASATISEFTSLVKSIRRVEECLGVSEKSFSSEEEEIARVARKSIVATRNIQPGEILKGEDICFKRPGTGFLPTELENVLGRVVKKRIESNRIIRREHLQWDTD